MGCGAREVAGAVRVLADVVVEHRNELVRLDREIGDGDHGENLSRGFLAAAEKVELAAPATPGAVLKLVATTLISTVGGAAGPLYGTALLRAATALGEVAELSGDDVAHALRAALDGVVARGKAQVGDKTMVDALSPAAAAAAGLGAAGVGEVLAAAAAAADEGARATAPLVARKGRASYLGERAVGHVDPGARSTALLLAALARVAAG